MMLRGRKRVAFIGNIANNFYREAKALQAGPFDVHLFLNADDPDISKKPESDEPKLKGDYPSWIKTCRGFQWTVMSLIAYLVGIKNPLIKQNRNTINKLNEYDLCVLSSKETWFIPFLKKPTIFRVTGSDLTVSPLFSYKQYKKLNDLKKGSRLGEFKGWLHWNVSKIISKKSISAASFVDKSFGKPFSDALEKLAIPKSRQLSQFRLSIDTDVFCRNNSKEIYEKWGLLVDDTYFFLPSRLMIRRTPELLTTGQYKGSEKALTGFKYFLDSLSLDERKKSKLLIPQRSILVDMKLARELVLNLGIEENVIFLSGENPVGLTRYELIEIFSVSRGVLDDFGAGWYGSLSVEALSCGCPVISFVPPAMIDEMFGWNPFLSAFCAEEISKSLRMLYFNDHFFEDVSRKSRQWIMKFHSNKVVRKRLIEGLSEIIGYD